MINPQAPSRLPHGGQVVTFFHLLGFSICKNISGNVLQILLSKYLGETKAEGLRAEVYPRMTP